MYLGYEKVKMKVKLKNGKLEICAFIECCSLIQMEQGIICASWRMGAFIGTLELK